MAVETRDVVDAVATLIEDAYEKDPEQSLISNLSGVSQGDWTTLPSGAERSISEILEHVGWAKWMYDDYAFGDGSLRGDEPPLIPEGGASSRPPEELLAWLDQGHRRWLLPFKPSRTMLNWVVSGSPTGVTACRPASSSAS